MTHWLIAISVLLTTLQAPTIVQNNSLLSPTLKAEAAMGRQAASNVQSRLDFLADQPVNEYINRIGQKLVTTSNSAVPYTIRVTASKEINRVASGNFKQHDRPSRYSLKRMCRRLNAPNRSNE
jgi:predicted Zn-dependent protease